MQTANRDLGHFNINSYNIKDITLSLFYLNQSEIQKKHAASALLLMDKLIDAWHQWAYPSLPSPSSTRLLSLIHAARDMLAIVKPAIKQRIAKQIADVNHKAISETV